MRPAGLAALSDSELEMALTARELESLRQGFRERVTDTDVPAVRDLPATLPAVFASAAVRARQAGFDGVELHYAHAYTLASFLSARNTRDDGYGGERERRIRLPLEVLASVRSKVGSAFPVGCRMLAEDCIESGSTIEDTEYFAERLAGAGMDFISLSRGGKFEDASQPKIGEAAYPYTGRSGYECMPSYYSDAKGRSAAMSMRVPGSGRKSARLGSRRPSCSQAAYIILIRPSRRCAAARRISLASPARRWPIRIGF